MNQRRAFLKSCMVFGAMAATSTFAISGEISKLRGKLREAELLKSNAFDRVQPLAVANVMIDGEHRLVALMDEHAIDVTRLTQSMGMQAPRACSDLSHPTHLYGVRNALARIQETGREQPFVVDMSAVKHLPLSVEPTSLMHSSLQSVSINRLAQVAVLI